MEDGAGGALVLTNHGARNVIRLRLESFSFNFKGHLVAVLESVSVISHDLLQQVPFTQLMFMFFWPL